MSLSPTLYVAVHVNVASVRYQPDRTHKYDALLRGGITTEPRDKPVSHIVRI